MTSENETNIGQEIRKARERRGISLSKLAEKAEVSKSYLSNLETGKLENPTIEVLERLARALDVKMQIPLENFTPGEHLQETNSEKSANKEKTSGFSLGYHHAYDGLKENSSTYQNKFNRAVALVKDVLSDETISKEKREQVAEEVISLMKKITFWLR